MGIDFALSDQQETLETTFARFFAAESSVAVVRASEPLVFDAELWTKLDAMDAGSIRADGATLSDLVVIAERAGSSMAPVPLVEHWVATQILAAHGLTASGQTVGPSADAPIGSAPSPSTPSAPAPSAVDALAGTSIATVALSPAMDGVWRLVPAGAVADVVVGIDGDELMAVRAEPPMEAPTNHASMPMADRPSTDGERVILGRLDPDSSTTFLSKPLSLHQQAINEWRLLTAASLLGIATEALALGVAYVNERQQFGRPIGAYQSIQHGLADLPAMIDGARSLTHKAAWAADTGLVDGAGEIDMDRGLITECGPLASMAFLAAGDAAAAATERSLHYHGGYGFSKEYDIQLLFRRARGWAHVGGNPEIERARLADMLWPR